MKCITLYDLIKQSAKQAIQLQRQDGSFPPGHNGAYFDEETPARNTGNWLITLLKSYSLTKDEEYLESAERALEYLFGTEVRPMAASYWHRKNPHKDSCNGVLGQAFTIEALTTAFESMGKEKAIDIAESVFLLHPFNDNDGAWHRVSIDGTVLSYDSTFNHQLYFAASGACLYKVAGNDEINRRVLVFLDRMQNTLKTYKLIHQGMIMHPLYSSSFHNGGMAGGIKRAVLTVHQMRHKQIVKATAYHAYNLYAFALLKKCYPDHEFWNSKKFKEIFLFIDSCDYINRTEAPGFSDPYSPAGFETALIERAFAYETFYPGEKYQEEIRNLVSKHFIKTFDFNTSMMNKCTADPLSQSARICKATRLSDMELNIERRNHPYE